MNVKDSIKEWYYAEGASLIKKYFVDVDGIYSTNNGKAKGVYGIYIQTPFGREIPMYIGMVGAENRSFRDRITEHSKYYFSRPEFYTGISRTELEEGYKFLVRILAIEDDEEKRYSIEQNLIEIMKPYLQYGCYPKYKSD